MSKEKGCCPEKVELLIQDERSRFTEEDREWLLTLSEEMLEKVQPVIVEKEVIKEVQVNKEIPVTKEQIVQALNQSFADEKNFLSLVPSSIRDQLESGLRLHAEQRQKWIDHIMANQATQVWGKEQLAAMAASDLERLSLSIPAKVNYTLRGAPVASYANGGVEEEKLMPFSVTAAASK